MRWEMSGGTRQRCKMMGRGAEGGCGIEEKPCPVSRVSSHAPSFTTASATDEMPGYVGVAGTGGVDFFAQARKVLAERSPFDSEEVAARVTTLPVSLAVAYARHADGRRKHKKVVSTEQGKKTKVVVPSPTSVVRNVWTETEEYFRDVTLGDIDWLVPKLPSLQDPCLFVPVLPGRPKKVYSDRLSGAVQEDKLGTIPNVTDIGVLETDRENNELADADEGSHAVEAEAAGVEEEMGAVEQDGQSHDMMDIDEQDTYHGNIDSDDATAHENEEGKEHDFSLTWVLSTKNRAFITSERPKKRRKLLEFPHPVHQDLPICDCCCSHGSVSSSNHMLCCNSCGVSVHQKCYGVSNASTGAWLCSWCQHLADIGRPSTEGGSCLLCPKKGGALKPVGENWRRNKKDLGFVHLFCSLWTPEVFVDNLESMEPILNIEGIQETRRKLVCHVCKVKHGTCVRCSYGTCKVSFHPLCARESNYRMEIWGKAGCNNVELCVFCPKHAISQDITSAQHMENIVRKIGNGSLEDNSMTMKLSTVNKVMALRSADNKAMLEQNADMISDDVSMNGKPLEQGTLAVKLISNDTEAMLNENMQDLNNDNALNDDLSIYPKSIYILKKLIEKEKIKIDDAALETSISVDSLKAAIAGEPNALSLDMGLRLARWLMDIIYIIAPMARSLTPSLLPRSFEDIFLLSPIEFMTAIIVVFLVIGDGSERAGSSLKNLPEYEGVDQVDEGPMVMVSANHSEVDELISGAPDVKVLKSLDCSISPFIEKRLMQINSLVRNVETKCDRYNDANSCKAQVPHLITVENALGLSQSKYSDEMKEIKLEDSAKVKATGIIKFSPEDEVEGEILHLQNKLLDAAIVIKNHHERLIFKVASTITEELDAMKQKRWDSLIANRFLREVREAKKRGRKERRHREAQAILAAATADAAASRVPPLRQEMEDSATQKEHSTVEAVSDDLSALHPKAKEKPPKCISKQSHGKSSDISILSCDICKRDETMMNPIFVCGGCKVTVHLGCYRKCIDPISSWYCEPCEAQISQSRSSITTWESKGIPTLLLQCGLCGTTCGAFRKTTDGQWVHAFCAEWILESTFCRGQEDNVDGMDTILETRDTLSCCICHQKIGVCVKCAHGHCQIAFHPICARSAGLYMNTKHIGGHMQHKAYCQKHSQEQRDKAAKPGVEELRSIRHIRVELEKLRLLCERIIKREKLKRELVLCSHGILSSKREYAAFSMLVRSRPLQSGISSESATTSINNTSYSETVERSDDITVDSTVSGKRKIILPSRISNERMTSEQSGIHLPFVQKVTNRNRTSFSGKQLPRRPASVASDSANEERKFKPRKRAEIFQKEVVMTSDQASKQNQRLPKGFVYVPVDSLQKPKDIQYRDPQLPDG